MTDDPTHDHLRALLAEQTARAERAEAEAEVRSGRWCEKNRNEGRGGCGMCGWCCKQSREDRDLAIIEAARRMTERDAALAANAELRAALEAVLAEYDSDITNGLKAPCEAAHRLLSRPDLGAGMVVVPREVVERARDEALQSIATIMVFLNDSPLIDRLRVVVADLDALLKKGGG